MADSHRYLYWLYCQPHHELTLAQLMMAMIKYDGGDAPRIQHFVKVQDFARMIAIAEVLSKK